MRTMCHFRVQLYTKARVSEVCARAGCRVHNIGYVNTDASLLASSKGRLRFSLPLSPSTPDQMHNFSCVGSVRYFLIEGGDLIKSHSIPFIDRNLQSPLSSSVRCLSL